MNPSFFFQDDIIDDVGEFVAAAEILKERGAYKIYIMATHGLLSADAPRLIEESTIDEVKISKSLNRKTVELCWKCSVVLIYYATQKKREYFLLMEGIFPESVWYLFSCNPKEEAVLTFWNISVTY